VALIVAVVVLVSGITYWSFSRPADGRLKLVGGRTDKVECTKDTANDEWILFSCNDQAFARCRRIDVVPLGEHFIGIGSFESASQRFQVTWIGDRMIRLDIRPKPPSRFDSFLARLINDVKITLADIAL
jgi:hypothetical protein